MKPIIPIKRINRKEYCYEDTPYYDPEKKQIRQKSRYPWKNVNGAPLKVRSEAVTEIVSDPRSASTDGSLLPMRQVVSELKLDWSLEKLATEEERETVLALAFHRVVWPSAIHLVVAWYEERSLVLDQPVLPPWQPTDQQAPYHDRKDRDVGGVHAAAGAGHGY